jgi:hypothetical protein
MERWWLDGGKSELVSRLCHFAFICDGWVPLLQFLGVQDFVDFTKHVLDREGIDVCFDYHSTRRFCFGEV